MHARWVLSIFLIPILMLCWGCASTVPSKKPTVNAPNIIEEDVPESRPTESMGQPTDPSGNVPPGSSIGGLPPAFPENPQAGGDPAKKPPRRIKFYDNQGSGRNWE